MASQMSGCGFSGIEYIEKHRETTTAQLRSEFCFPDRLFILNEVEYFDKSFRDINDQMPF